MIPNSVIVQLGLQLGKAAAQSRQFRLRDGFTAAVRRHQDQHNNQQHPQRYGRKLLKLPKERSIDGSESRSQDGPVPGGS